MILHLLNTGAHKGGVQTWGKNLARDFPTLITSSLHQGSIQESFEEDGLKFKEFSIGLVRSATHILCSDYTATIVGALLCAFFNRKAEFLFIIHSNREKSLEKFVIFVAKCLRPNGHFIATTKEQIEKFRFLKSQTTLIALNSSEKGFLNRKFSSLDAENTMYFGRLSEEKKTDVLLEQRENYNKRHQLYIFGDGSPAYIERLRPKDKNIFLKIGWFNMSQVIKEYNIGYIVIPNENEGISLVTIEALANGVIPICRHKSAFSTLKLPEYVRWDGGESLLNVVERIKSIGKEKVLIECRSSVSNYYKETSTINNLLGSG